MLRSSVGRGGEKNQHKIWGHRRIQQRGGVRCCAGDTAQQGMCAYAAFICGEGRGEKSAQNMRASQNPAKWRGKVLRWPCGGWQGDNTPANLSIFTCALVRVGGGVCLFTCVLVGVGVI